MSCPICGANCRCKRRGPGGLCCSCHRHKARKILDAVRLRPREELTPEMLRGLEDHEKSNARAEEKAQANP